MSKLKTLALYVMFAYNALVICTTMMVLGVLTTGGSPWGLLLGSLVGTYISLRLNFFLEDLLRGRL